MVVVYHCVSCQVTRRWRLTDDGSVSPVELEKAIWMIHMDETNLGQSCDAVEIFMPTVWGRNLVQEDSVWYLFLPRMLSPLQYRRAIREGCAEIEYLLDGEFVVFRYLSGIPKPQNQRSSL